METLKFFKCNHCGNMFEVIYGSGVTPVCCGDNMQALTANTSDGAGEKHVPAVERNGKSLTAKIGSVTHPMEEKHYIVSIFVQQGDKVQHVSLKPGMAPEATFTLDSDTAPVTVYEYCNLHGLWSAEA